MRPIVAQATIVSVCGDLDGKEIQKEWIHMNRSQLPFLYSRN